MNPESWPGQCRQTWHFLQGCHLAQPGLEWCRERRKLACLCNWKEPSPRFAWHVIFARNCPRPRAPGSGNQCWRWLSIHVHWPRVFHILCSENHCWIWGNGPIFQSFSHDKAGLNVLFFLFWEHINCWKIWTFHWVTFITWNGLNDEANVQKMKHCNQNCVAKDQNKSGEKVGVNRGRLSHYFRSKSGVKFPTNHLQNPSRNVGNHNLTLLWSCHCQTWQKIFHKCKSTRISLTLKAEASNFNCARAKIQRGFVTFIWQKWLIIASLVTKPLKVQSFKG